MSTDDGARYEAMVEFLGTFPTLSGNAPADLEELSDGVALFEALSEIAPSFFDPTTIARHLGDNWALKASNVRKLLRNMETFFHEGLKKDADFGAQSLKVNSIARNSDCPAIAELFELVAAAAVTCENRGEFVGRIMGMTPENQIHMKDIIQSSLSRLTDYVDGDDDHSDDDTEGDENELVFDRAPPTATSNFEDGRLFSRNVPRNATTDVEREELEKALANARRELAAHKSQSALLAEDNESSQRKLRAIMEDLQDRLLRRQNELITAEEELKAATSELDDTKAKVSELEEQKAQLADELDVATAKAEQLRKAEATVVAYRKKLEGVGVMNQQMTDLEDQAASYLRQIMDLETDVKKVPALQKTIDELQTKFALLEREHAIASESCKTSANEISELKSRLSAADGAKKMYEEELAALRAQQDDGTALDDDVGAVSNGLSLTSAKSIAEAKEKSLRLEIENKTLKDELEKLKQQDGKTNGAIAVAGSDTENVISWQAEVSRLKEALAQKEAEKAKIGSDKEKLEAYTKRTLAKFQEKYLVALQECKAKLKEKQDKIEALESRGSSEKTAQKREERLLSSTIYELGLAIMQDRLKER